MAAVADKDNKLKRKGFKMKFLLVIATMLFGFQAFAGFGGYNSGQTLGLFEWIQCSSGLTCTKFKDRMIITAGAASSTNNRTNFHGYIPSALSGVGTSVTGNSGTIGLTQIAIPNSVTISQLGILNGATVGTNKYILVLYNNSGVPVANTTLSGTTTSGANSYQLISLTSPYTAAAGVYWLGANLNGATDNYQAAPAIAQPDGLAGSDTTGNIFGTLVPVTLPTSFTAGLGPIMFTN